MPRKKSAEPRVLVFGDVNVDLIGLTAAWPHPGQECLTDHLELHCGGVGANCALALRQWRVATSLIACVGHDPLGDTVLARLASHGANTRHIQRTRNALTGLLYINVTRDGQRTFFGSRGANQLVRAHSSQRALMRRAQAVSLMGYSFLDSSPTKAANQLLSAARSLGKWVALDVGMEPSQKIPKKILRVLRHVDLLFVSHEEAAALTGSRDPRKSFRILQCAGAREVVMKLAKHGCLIADRGELRNVPAFPVRSVDSTGAGDAFTAAFLQARLRGWPAPESALLANAVGAVAAGVVGAGDAAPTAKQVATLVRTARLKREWETMRLRVLRRLSSGAQHRSAQSFDERKMRQKIS